MEEQPPATQKAKWGPAAAIIVSVVVYFASQLLGGIVISLVALQLHHDPNQAEIWFRGNVWAQFLFVVTAEVLTLSLLHIFLRRREATFRDLGLSRPKPKYAIYAVLGFGFYIAVYFIALAVIIALLPSLNTEQKQELGFNTAAHGSALWLIFVSLVILPPIVEEIVARGFLYGGLRTKLKPAGAALITSGIFALPHLAEGGSSGVLWVAGIDTFILSLVLCYLREKTGSLWPSIGVHMLKNGLAFVVLFNVVQYLR